MEDLTPAIDLLLAISKESLENGEVGLELEFSLNNLVGTPDSGPLLPLSEILEDDLVLEQELGLGSREGLEDLKVFFSAH